MAIGGVALWNSAPDTRIEADQIDFVSLHRQASLAMQKLQAAQERHVAALQTGESEF